MRKSLNRLTSKIETFEENIKNTIRGVEGRVRTDMDDFKTLVEADLDIKDEKLDKIMIKYQNNTEMIYSKLSTMEDAESLKSYSHTQDKIIQDSIMYELKSIDMQVNDKIKAIQKHSQLVDKAIVENEQFRNADKQMIQSTQDRLDKVMTMFESKSKHMDKKLEDVQNQIRTQMDNNIKELKSQIEIIKSHSATKISQFSKNFKKLFDDMNQEYDSRLRHVESKDLTPLERRITQNEKSLEKMNEHNKAFNRTITNKFKDVDETVTKIQNEDKKEELIKTK